MKVLNHLGAFVPRTLAGISLATVALSIYLVGAVFAGPEAAPQKPAEKITLSGADLYAIHCNRCHAERYATEFTAAHWKTIMLHMRVRANLTAEQAREVLKYLQEDSGQ
jgi:mono/diheme cytochrome c family protein